MRLGLATGMEDGFQSWSDVGGKYGSEKRRH